jgi:hypothetical protein
VLASAYVTDGLTAWALAAVSRARTNLARGSTLGGAGAWAWHRRFEQGPAGRVFLVH